MTEIKEIVIPILTVMELAMAAVQKGLKIWEVRALSISGILSEIGFGREMKQR